MWLCLISLEQWRKKNKIIKNKLENELFTYSLGYLVVYFTLRSSFACTSLPTILCSGVSCNSISGGPLLYKKKSKNEILYSLQKNVMLSGKWWKRPSQIFFSMYVRDFHERKPAKKYFFQKFCSELNLWTCKVSLSIIQIWK